MRFLLGLVRVFTVHAFDLEQRKELFLFLGRTNLARHQVAGLQIEPANLRRRHVNVFGTRQVVETLRAQEAEAFRQDLQHALGKQHTRALGIFLQDVENHLVLAHRAEVFHAQFARHGVQVIHGHRLELGDVQRRGDVIALFGAGDGLGFLDHLDRGGGRLQFIGRRFGHGRGGRYGVDRVGCRLLRRARFHHFGLGPFRRGSWHKVDLA